MNTRAGHLVVFFLLLLPLAASPSLAAATNCNPENGWTNTDPDTVLYWKPGGTNELSFNVFFGTISNLGPAQFRGNQTNTIYCPGTLKTNQTYYWRIDSVTNNTNPPITGTVWSFTVNPTTPGTITRVDSMPSRPSNYVLRDWKKTARDFSALVTDTNRSGTYLPIATKEDDPKHNITNEFWWIPSFVGFNDDAGALGGMVNVVGATLSGTTNLTNASGINYVIAQASYFSINKGYDVLFHSHKGGPLDSFWYQLIANIAFWQMVDLYSDVQFSGLATNTLIQGNTNTNTGTAMQYTLADMMVHSADKWHEVSTNLATFVPANHVFPATNADRTVDNADGTGVAVTGPWVTNPAITGCYGTNFLQINASNSAASTGVTFTPNLSHGGSYEVLARWPAATNWASDASMTVNYGSKSKTFRINQRTNGSTWRSLGVFDFEAGTAGSVRVNSTTTNGSAVNGPVAADAVMFKRQSIYPEHPDYNPYPGYAYYGFDFGQMQPNNTEGTLMPHSAAGLAWLQLMAHEAIVPTQDDYLSDADQALRFLQDLPINPSHDVLLPYGILAAARMNAERGRNYNVGKFFNWHFDEGEEGDVNEHTGVAVGNYGNRPVDGLVGKTGLEKVYPVNTFMSAGILAPVARYDQRYAKHIGKWLLNLASNARLFYTHSLSSTNESNWAWCHTYDTNNALTYEFLSNESWIVTKAAEHSTNYSELWVGTDSATNDVTATNTNAPAAREFKDKTYLKFKTTTAGSSVIWALNLPPGKMRDTNAPPHDFKVVAKVVGKNYGFSWDTAPDGVFTNSLLTLTTSDNASLKEVSANSFFGTTGGATTVYVKAEALQNGTGELWLDTVLVQTRNTDQAPFLAGGHMGHGGRTDLCLYQGSSSGYLGAIVEESNISEILKIDLLATDFFHADAYPTWLYYNPHPVEKFVTVNLGSSFVDVYDTVDQSFALTNVNGAQVIQIPAESARILVQTPPRAPGTGVRSYEGRKFKIDGVVVDYRYPVKTRVFCDGFETGSYTNATTGSWSNSASTSVIGVAKYSGAFGAKLSNKGSITRAVDTTGYSGIYLKYRRTVTGYGADEGLVVEWSPDGGANWTTLETATNGAYADLQNKSCGAGAANKSGFQVRFKSAGSDTTEYSYIDDVEIVGNLMD